MCPTRRYLERWRTVVLGGEEVWVSRRSCDAPRAIRRVC